jgi:penicillin-binding protein 2
MYNKRIKIFVILVALLLLAFLLRLAQMQLLDDSFYRERIANLKLQKGLSRQLKTIRGKILDRQGKILAVDELQFQLHISYQLSSFMDARVRRAKLLKAAREKDSDKAVSEMEKELKTGIEDLQRIVNKCAQFKGVEPSEIENEINKINGFIWNRRVFQAWRRNFPNSEVFRKYDNIISIPAPEAVADFEKKQPSPLKRLELVNEIDIAEMHESMPLLELKTDDDIFTAQLEFMDVNGVRILPKGHRLYPYGSVAAQTIGWVGLPQQSDEELFENDKLLSYLSDEVCGREDGIEYVCETILRGRRGEVVYDIDREMQSRTETQFGRNVSLTLDIELQKRIEDCLVNYNRGSNCGPGIAAVVIDVTTGDILALVSMPNFDLNRIRYDYGEMAFDPNKPMLNRAIYEQYPPGSAVKPLILIAGLESGKISPDEIISCPAQPAPKDWPNCWLYNKYHWMGHDDKWPNNARNAIKGSCNIYFSRLADRIDPNVLQHWLFDFGYGRKILLPPDAIRRTEHGRNLRQAMGQISTYIPDSEISAFEQLSPLEKGERRFFGIGQGNLRVTPLQVANAMAAIARGGLYRLPRLYMEEDSSPFVSIDLNISPQTLAVIYDGMSAVVNESGGTAYNEFAHSGLSEQGVTVYGKTGSTEKPDNAWFAGFAADRTDRSIAIAVVVEGGQHGSSDAAPLARDIIQFCIEAGYIGRTPNAK